MRTVAEIVPYNTKKVKVKLDDGFTFAFYKGELKKYKMKEGNCISDEVFHEIIYGVLMKRARERAFHILKDSSRTRMQMIEKLKKDYYPEVIINETIEFLERYNYINDYEFTMNYIERNTENKSLSRMRNELYVKGISKAVIEEVLSKIEVDDDSAIKKLIDRKINRYNLNEPKDKRKFYGLLQRNGYTYDTIQRTMKALELED